MFSLGEVGNIGVFATLLVLFIFVFGGLSLPIVLCTLFLTVMAFRLAK